ncbi:MAG TPA: hypothetical protein VJP85_03690 [Candidatus Baltobacteraceae bacterium]|nr:hypothetical protein [Candidatus Baltobacteraceae bacterium]
MCLVDLDLATEASDASWTPAEVFEYARDFNLCLFSVTDWDAPQTLDVPEDLRDKYVPGVRTRAEIGDCAVDVFLYGAIAPDSPLAHELAEQRERRHDCTVETVFKLIEHGIIITLKDIIADAGPECRSLEPIHVARTLVRLGAVKTTEEAFRRYVGLTGSCYAGSPRLSFGELVDMAQDLDLIIALPHPLGYRVVEEIRKLQITIVPIGHPAHATTPGAWLDDQNERIVLTVGLASRGANPRLPVRVSHNFITYVRTRLARQGSKAEQPSAER